MGPCISLSLFLSNPNCVSNGNGIYFFTNFLTKQKEIPINAKFNKISGNGKIDSDIVKTSAFKNHYYKIQKYFENFDKVELFFSNPTSKVIKFSIDKKNYILKGGCSLLIDVTDQKTINIKSNCLFLRPTVFSYKNNYLDVHHS